MTTQQFDAHAAELWALDDGGKQFELWLNHEVAAEDNADELFAHYEESL